MTAFVLSAETGPAFENLHKDTQRYAALDILREADRDEKTLDGCAVLKGLESYSALLEARSYLDYSTILEAAVDVLTNDRALRERLTERIHCVIVDEYPRRLSRRLVEPLGFTGTAEPKKGAC
jgi:ATP-dependent exoDNAse (exonuclease V) beta subunit